MVVAVAGVLMVQVHMAVVAGAGLLLLVAGVRLRVANATSAMR